MVWFVLAGMAACAVLIALLPLLRPSLSAKADPAANEAAFYKAPLDEISRGGERPRRSRAPPDRRSVQPLSGVAASAPLSPGSGGADRRRTASDRLSPLCAAP